MSIKLSKEQIKDIRHLQKNLDIRVRELNTISMLFCIFLISLICSLLNLILIIFLQYYNSSSSLIITFFLFSANALRPNSQVCIMADIPAQVMLSSL